MFGMFGEGVRTQFDESPHSSDGEEEEDDDWATLDGTAPRGEPSQLRPVQPADPDKPWLDLPPALLRLLLLSLAGRHSAAVPRRLPRLA